MDEEGGADEEKDGLRTPSQDAQLDGDAGGFRQVPLRADVGLGDDAGGYAEEGGVEELDHDVEDGDGEAARCQGDRSYPPDPGAVDERGDRVRGEGEEGREGYRDDAVIDAQAALVLCACGGGRGVA